MGFFKADARLWPGLVEPFVAGRVEWSADAVRLDLAWMVDQAEAGFPFEVDGRMYRGRVPGRPALRRRWRVSDRRVRTLLQELGPREAEPERTASVQRMSSERTASGQRVSSERTASGQRVSSERTAGAKANAGNAAKPDSECPAGVQRVSSERTASVQPMSTGAFTSLQPPASRTPDIRVTVETTAPPLALVEPVQTPADTWGQLADFYAQLPGCRRPRSRNVGNGKLLARLLDHHGPDDARTVLRWWAFDNAPESRARYLREHGHRLDTLTRAERIDAYAEMALAWKAAGSRGDPDAQPARAAPPATRYDRPPPTPLLQMPSRRPTDA
jgi:hypothetical protein